MGIIFSRDLTNPHQNMFSISASANAVVCSANKTTKRSTKVVSKNNTAKNAALLAATIATISTSGAALADDIEDVYAAAYAQNRSFGVVSPEHSAIDDANARKASSPMKKFVRPESAEAGEERGRRAPVFFAEHRNSVGVFAVFAELR